MGKLYSELSSDKGRKVGNTKQHTEQDTVHGHMNMKFQEGEKTHRFMMGDMRTAELLVSKE
jgi:hypothetical protein